MLLAEIPRLVYAKLVTREFACDDRPPTQGSLRIRGTSVLTFLSCDRQTFTAYSNATWTEYVLTDEGYAQLGPSIQDIVAHVDGEAFDADFKYKLVVQRSFRGSNWEDATSGDLLGPQTAEGYKSNGTPFSNRADIGLRTRVVLRTQQAQAGAPQSGTLSVVLAVRVFAT